MKKLLGLFAVGSALFLGGVAQAQPGAPMPGAPGAMPPAAAPSTSVSITQETYTDPNTMSLDSPDSGTMPATGGAPIAMALSGMLAAGGAFFARRKLA